MLETVRRDVQAGCMSLLDGSDMRFESLATGIPHEVSVFNTGDGEAGRDEPCLFTRLHR
jgi:hypothetical protein